MSLSVDPKICSVCIKNSDRVKQTILIALIKAYGKHNGKLLSNLGKMPDGFIFLYRLCKAIIIVSALLAKILPLKQLREQNDLCPFGGCLSDKLLRMGDILFHLICAAHLYGCNLHFSHNCFLQTILIHPGHAHTYPGCALTYSIGAMILFCFGICCVMQ